MKKLLLLALLFVLVVGGTLAVTAHYDAYKNKKQQDTQATREAEAQEASALQAQARLESVAAFDRIKAQYEVLRIECEKGVQAYERLTAYQKTQVKEPNCTLLQE